VLAYPHASTAAAAGAAIIIIYRHRENLGRLLAGNEPRLGDRAASARAGG
jgi:glycerol-3-phosphate acyltransferase PlsY